MLWPLGLTIAVWFVASLVIGRLYPEAVQRFTVVPNQFAQEERYIGNNIAMTRLAYDLEEWGDVPFRGEAVLTAGRHRARGRHVHQRPAVGLPPAALDARPAPDGSPLLRLHRRRHRPLRHRRHQAPGHARPLESCGSSRTRARPAGSTSGSSSPTASAPRWSRSTRSGARASRACSSATCRRCPCRAPRRSPSRASTSASGRRRTSSSAPSRPSSTTRPARATKAARSGPRRAGRVPPGSRSTRR